MHRYNFHDLFSLQTNVPYFEEMFHFFKSDRRVNPEFSFMLDDKLSILVDGKPHINLMFYYDSKNNATEFSYPWLRPIRARLMLDMNLTGFRFTFNRNYYRFSSLAAEGWELVDVLRSLLQVILLSKGLYMIHGAALKVRGRGILIPSFGNTGKTATSWLLGTRGAEFLTDEFAIMDSQGKCYSFPCSSLLQPATIRALKMNLKVREKFSLSFSQLKSRMFTTRIAPGGLRAHPENFLRVCDTAGLSRVVFIENGTSSVHTIDSREALRRLRAVQSYELNWRANPFIIAHAFFNRSIDLGLLSKLEEEFLDRLFSKINEFTLVSSSSGTHYKMIEEIAAS